VKKQTHYTKRIPIADKDLRNTTFKRQWTKEEILRVNLALLDLLLQRLFVLTTLPGAVNTSGPSSFAPAIQGKK